MKHLPMDPAVAELISHWAAEHIDEKAKVWTIARSTGGGLEEALDLDHLLKLNPGRGLDELIDALFSELALRDVAEARSW